MKITAIVAARNESLYLERCFKHLKAQGIDICYIDNGSTDGSLDIAHRFLGKGILRIEEFPYKGFYDWKGLLEYKEKLANEISSDWFIHCDADEIMEAPQPFATLTEGIRTADKLGYNVINFDEFVFLPTESSENFEERDYVAEMKHYYFFEPKPLRLMRAWKKQSAGVGLSSEGGHGLQINDLQIFPENFVLRHYITLSQSHALSKYGSRIYAAHEYLEKGWHDNRVIFYPQALSLPSKENLHVYNDDGKWEKSKHRTWRPC